MAVPPGVSEREWADALKQFQQALGSGGVFTSDEDVALYRDFYSPLWGEAEERVASAALAPDTADQVQQIVRIANTSRIPLYSIATGRNLGYGGSAPNLAGSVVLDLKRMNRVLEVDDKRHFAIVEPGVSYFDFYRHIQDRGLNVWIDCPDPGWGSVIGNALDHGVGYTWGAFRDHFHSHCGMEVVLPNGEFLRTGMGAVPGSRTWAEYRYGYGPYVDGLFSQGNFGVVTKMGFWLFPAPETYLSGTVTVPKRADIVPLVDIVNYLEHAGTIGMPRYGSPLGQVRDQELADLVAQPGGPSTDDLDAFAARRGVAAWECKLQFYGGAEVVAAQWAYAREKLSVIAGARFEDTEFYRFPLTAEQAERAHKVALGIPNLSIFAGGARSELNPSPRDGHVFFAPVIPKSGRAILDAMQVFNPVVREVGFPNMVSFFKAPNTWMFRAFVFLYSFPISRSDRAQNRRVREAFPRLVRAAAERGWGEYRTPPVFQDLVMDAYSFNNHALRRFSETLKDAVDPNGILSAGRGGIWPRHLRNTRG
ncbi:MAG: FAD-binding oxidoreductase [Acidobacteria bacterium]|nr:FAD-binding oxidoreductase [Acidobacteriota bacterium]